MMAGYTKEDLDDFVENISPEQYSEFNVNVRVPYRSIGKWFVIYRKGIMVGISRLIEISNFNLYEDTFVFCPPFKVDDINVELSEGKTMLTYPNGSLGFLFEKRFRFCVTPTIQIKRTQMAI